ncbi:beclin-2-like [Thomomys bottae]
MESSTRPRASYSSASSARAADSPETSASNSSLAGDGGKSSESSDQFTLLGTVASIQTLSSTLQSLAGIFDIFSGEEVDHPLCEDCTDHLLEHLDTQFSEVQLDCQAYSRALESELLMNQEDRKFLTHQAAGRPMEPEMDGGDADSDGGCRAGLGPSCRGSQGLRGYLPPVAVDWTEINAAWGQTVLLLLALANSIGLKFQRYQLVAGGNHSYLKSLTNDGVTLPLFSDGQHNVFPNNKYDLAMMAFLDCMQQFKKEAEKETECFSLPYSMYPEQGTIWDDKGSGKQYSIQIQTHLNTVEEWTVALKLLLGPQESTVKSSFALFSNTVK